MDKIKIGIIGMGTVGQGVWKHLADRGEMLTAEVGAPLEIARVLVRDPAKSRDVDIPADRLTTKVADILDDDSIRIVCELAGGTGEVREWVLAALRSGKSVVSANKALICEYGKELFDAATVGGSQLFFEASVAGGIPVIKALREGLVVNRFQRIYGILNGTSNYILTRMEKEQAPFGAILEEARKLGYVEADESLDLDGWDAAHKTVILARLAHRKWVPTKAMIVEGIRAVTLDDMRFAGELGYRIKLIARIDYVAAAETLSLSVRPTLVPLDSLMADVSGAFNAISLHADVAGPTSLIGRGAGRDPTASAVIADLVDAGRSCISGGHPRSRSARWESDPRDAEASEIESEYYIRLKVADQAGVLAEVAHVFSRSTVSIATVIQRDHEKEGTASLVLLTHLCSEQSIRDAMSLLKREKCVLGEFLCCPLLV